VAVRIAEWRALVVPRARVGSAARQALPRLAERRPPVAVRGLLAALRVAVRIAARRVRGRLVVRLRDLPAGRPATPTSVA
jgi:hypothetical protein